MPTETYLFHGQQFEWDTDKGLHNIEKHGIGSAIRIISARKATKTEQAKYRR